MAAESKDMTDDIKETTSDTTSTEVAAEPSVAVAEKPAAKVSVGKLSASELIRAFEAEQIAKQAKDHP